MTTLSRTDLQIFPRLSIITVDGFPAEESGDTDGPGSLNYLLERVYPTQYVHDITPEAPGVLWADYDTDCSLGPHASRVLIATDEVDDFREKAEEAGYAILEVEEVKEPTTFGSPDTVTILQHPDGWVLAR